MTAIANATALVISAVLLWAALEKLRSPSSLAATLRSLGFPSQIAWPATALVPATEVLLAVALLFWPGSVLTQAGVVLLAAVFALAGLRALRLDQPVACNCFGAGGKNLGMTQVIAFFLWAAGAGILRFGIRDAPGVVTSAACFAALALGLAALRGLRVWRAQRVARDDRRSAQEMYEWLPAHSH